MLVTIAALCHLMLVTNQLEVNSFRGLPLGICHRSSAMGCAESDLGISDVLFEHAPVNVEICSLGINDNCRLLVPETGGLFVIKKDLLSIGGSIIREGRSGFAKSIKTGVKSRDRIVSSAYSVISEKVGLKRGTASGVLPLNMKHNSAADILHCARPIGWVRNHTIFDGRKERRDASEPRSLTPASYGQRAPSKIGGSGTYNQGEESNTNLAPANVNHVIGSNSHSLLRNKVILVTLLLALGGPLIGVGLINLGEVCEVRQDYYQVWPLIGGLCLFGFAPWLIIVLPDAHSGPQSQETYQASSSRSV